VSACKMCATMLDTRSAISSSMISPSR
jgi:hypothetical protein